MIIEGFFTSGKTKLNFYPSNVDAIQMIIDIERRDATRRRDFFKSLISV
jgi:hypothetical protein